ncbi:hypothetical protein BV22DRAFT_458408 [Leucogyrophana mollusca]|uniref:Uncharacterized protein n=1 Tax=Leucogyrophana mollusca TaxID=85980 RepID=A0ACB8BIL1_9AGAM|nr:hypothetical protein BV22DRAFT_458408 [Leucogyrophana mollusca]
MSLQPLELVLDPVGIKSITGRFWIWPACSLFRHHLSPTIGTAASLVIPPDNCAGHTSRIMELELIKEEWRPFSVTSRFSLPSVSQYRELPFFTGSCGLGWHFTIDKVKTKKKKGALSNKQEVEYAAHFSPFCSFRAYEREKVDVVVEFQSLKDREDREVLEASTLPALIPKNDPMHPVIPIKMPGSWTPEQLFDQASVAFTVTFVKTGPVQSITAFLRQRALGDYTTPPTVQVGASGDVSKAPAVAEVGDVERPDIAAVDIAGIRAVIKQPAVLLALAQSLGTGMFFDTKYVIFCRRRATGNITEPQTIYANSAVLKATSPHLALRPFEQQDCLLEPLSNNSSTQLPDVLDAYDYESDSDLDVDEIKAGDPTDTGSDYGAFEERVGGGIRKGARPSPSSVSGTKTLAEEGKKTPHAPSITTGAPDAVAKGDDGVVWSRWCRSALTHPNVISTLPIPDFEDDASEICIDQDELCPATVRPSVEAPSVARTVLVKGAAYRTWRALIYYCYTGQIVFAPLKSCNTVPSPTLQCDGATPCSPKSMYRLADELGIGALKDAAFAAICGDLSKENILDEAFSKFTSKYPAIQEMETDLLIQHCSAEEVVHAIPDKVKKISRGDVPHVDKVLSDFLQKLCKATVGGVEQCVPAPPTPLQRSARALDWSSKLG